MKKTEVFIDKINEFSTVIDCDDIKIVGISVPVSFESNGYGSGKVFGDITFNDYFIAKKYITDGTIDFLAAATGVNPNEYISARYNVRYDGNYDVIIGFVIDSFDNLPIALPENTTTLTVPACRFVKILINEKKSVNRIGYDERMAGDEYFISGFRNDTEYVYNNNSCPMNTYDKTGDMLAKYEPVKIPSNKSEKYDSIQFKVVLLPDMIIACSLQKQDDDDFVIFKYFRVMDKVLETGLAQYYLDNFYGFPANPVNEPLCSAFGSRVISFDGLPDCVEKITLNGGLYVHITQLEFNGDNPSIPYDVAFNHLNDLFLINNPQYERDHSKHVIARFRQANCASVFVPIKIK